MIEPMATRCEKRDYPTERVANVDVVTHPLWEPSCPKCRLGLDFRAYRCPSAPHWHVGHGRKGEEPMATIEHRPLVAPALLPGRLHADGMEIPPDLDFDVWEAALRNAEWIERAASWWVVDLVAFGRARFGEDYSQALPDAIEDADGFHQAKLRQAEWMADSWPPGTRVPGQSYSAHRAVAKLPRADAVALLEEKDTEGRRLPVRVLARRAVEIEEAIRGHAVDAGGERIETPEPLVWVPQRADLTGEARLELERRLAVVGKRHAIGYERAWLDCLLYLEQRDAFEVWRD